MDNCTQIEKYKQDLIDITNNSGLSVGVTYYIIKDFLNALETAYLQEYKKEQEQEGKTLSE